MYKKPMQRIVLAFLLSSATNRWPLKIRLKPARRVLQKYLAKRIPSAIYFARGVGARFMKIGYARVPTEDRRLTLQLEALKKAGCTRIFRERYREHSATGLS